jgi:hypothetical protein
VRRRKRRTRRNEIFERVCRDADEMDEPTPSISADRSAVGRLLDSVWLRKPEARLDRP